MNAQMVTFGFLVLICLASCSEKEVKEESSATTENTYQTRYIEGWKVQVSDKLIADQGEAVETALSLLKRQFEEIILVVPPAAVAHLLKVTIWFSPEYPNFPPKAEYHPGADWLIENGRNPEMALGVEFTNTLIFKRETIRMPNFALHELAHSYHHQVLTFENTEILSAFEQAKASGIYDNVERFNGENQANTFEMAYAINNQMEYFAESTEAFFSRNDFFPFDHDELELHDQTIFAVLSNVWGVSD